MANLVERVADRVMARGVSVAYGDKVELDGVETIPVALITYGFGAGGDSDDNGGGGGGGSVIPVGAYIADPDGPYFAPNPIALMAVAIPLVAVTGLAIALIAKALR